MAAARGTCRHGPMSQVDLSSALISMVKHAGRHYLTQHGRDSAVCFVCARWVAGHREHAVTNPACTGLVLVTMEDTQIKPHIFNTLQRGAAYPA